MKCLLLLFVAIAACAASVIKDPIQGYKEGDRYFYFAGDDGDLSIVDTEEPVNYAFITEYTSNAENNGYWLYTRANPTTAQILVQGNTQSVRGSHFDSKKLTVFLAHGWNSDGNNRMNKLLTEAFLQDGDVNVIVLDWGKLANKNYLTAKNGVAGVGRGLGGFINWMVANNFCSYDNMHLVGFSLGGHLVGNAGREAGSAIVRITALDPAGPLWGSDKNQLSATDAKYVEVIHANTAVLGHKQPCGDADFYPNGGHTQPGCSLLSACSHRRAYELMASTVKNNHLLANKCNTYKDASHDKCNGATNPMGNSNIHKSGRGIFRVNTKEEYPY